MANEDNKGKRRAGVLALAIALAAPAEGLRQYAYRDPAGIPTICFGSITGVKMGDFRTVPECKALLTQEMNDVIESVEKCRPGLPPEVLAAFSDAAFNVGAHIVCDSARSTAARMLLSHDYRGACNQLPRWNRASVAGVSVELPGLTKRRLLERELCLQGVT